MTLIMNIGYETILYRVILNWSSELSIFLELITGSWFLMNMFDKKNPFSEIKFDCTEMISKLTKICGLTINFFWNLLFIYFYEIMKNC